MAPEVLLGEPLNEKLDVYSFAYVFWEILTRKELFLEYNDKEIFTEDIARKGKRPPIDDIDPILVKILNMCWDENPDNRPLFEQIIPMLEKALIQIYLPTDLCAIAQSFWLMNYKYQPRAPFEEFALKLIRALKKVMVKTSIQLEMRGLRALLEEEVGEEKVVTIERFSAFLTWFGPLKTDTHTILEQMLTVLKSPWFFGKMSSEQSERQIASCLSKPRGLFLVRLNMGTQIPTNKSPFTITRVVDNTGKVIHSRVYTSKKNGLIIEFKSEKDKNNNIIIEGASITDLIRKLKHHQELLLADCCPGWPFGDIFNPPSPPFPYEELKPEDYT